MKLAIFLISFLIASKTAFAEQNKVHLQIWHMMMYSQRAVLQGLINEYQENNPHISVTAVYRETEELRSAYQSAAMGGSGPALIYGPSDQVGPFSTMGIIAPLENDFSQHELDDLDPLARITQKDHLYLIGDSVGNHLMLLYNKKLVSRPPENTNELIQIAQTLTKDFNQDGKPDQYGLVFNYTEPFFFVPWIKGFGDGFVSKDGYPQLISSSIEPALEFLIQLRDKYKIIPKECDYETANALFKEGKAAFIINGDWSWGDYKESKIEFGAAPLPLISSTKLRPAPLVGTKGYSLNPRLKDQERSEAIRLLKFLISAQAQLIYTEKLNTLPSLMSLRHSDLVARNELLQASAEAMKYSDPMPIVPEVRAVWDSLRGEYQSVLAGTKSAKEATRAAQEKTQKQIKTMNEIIEPTFDANLIQVIFALLISWIFIIGIRSFQTIFSKWKDYKFPLLLLLPSLIAIFLVVIYPFAYNVLISVSNFSLRTFRDWQIVGFQHYVEVLTDSQFYLILTKTILWTVTNVFMHVTIGIFLALIINQTLPAKPLFRILLIIPWAVPQYITALTWRGLFNQEYGPINIFLSEYLNLSPLQWLSDPFLAFVSCFITNVWLGFPFMMMVALGGLQSIPKHLYEAAMVDGANHWQRFRMITWPLLQPVMRPAIVLGSIWTFNSLNVIWLVSNSGEPADQTHILVSYVYKSAFNLYRFSYSSALSMLIFLILLSFGQWFMMKQNQNEEILK